MAIVHVGKCRSLIEIEQFISKMSKPNAAEIDTFVFSVECLKARHSPMHDASRLQMLVTLARQRLQSDYLDIHPNSNEEGAIDGICDYSPGIAVARLTKGIRIGGTKIERREVLKAAVQKMHATNSEDFNKVVRGRTIDLISISGSKIQYLRPLFSADAEVKEYIDMRMAMRSLVSFVNQESKKKIPDSLIKALGVFSTELIQNTQDHAVTNHAGKPYLAHVEGMILGWTRFNQDLFSKDFSGHPTLKSYWNVESSKSDLGVTSLRAFEVSYFDSGPGLVSRFKGWPVTDIPIEEEKKSLLECLQHKATSKSEDAAGQGLPLVLDELKKIGGLMRIRSGRLSMFNAFTPNDLERDLFDFEDWTQTQLAPVEGAVISILVPLRGE